MNRSHFGFPRGRALDLLGFPRGSYGAEFEVMPPIDGYTAWYDAAARETITVDSNSLIHVWRDRSPNGFDLIQSTSANRPAYGTRRMNNVLVVDYDGTDDYLRSHKPFMPRPSSGFIVVEFDALGAEVRLFDGPIVNTIVWGKDASNNMFYAVVGGLTRTMTRPLIATRPYVLGWVIDAGSAITFYLNEYTESIADVQASTLRLLCIGARDGGTSGLNGAIAEVIMYDTALDHVQSQKVIRWLREKWGVP